MVSDPIGFWEERHASSDPWRSGGDRGLGSEENYEFYAYRLGRLIELLRRHAGGERGQRILDAGCGRGHFTDGLRRCGHQVLGIDTSATAVAWAREHYGPHFEQAALDGYQPPQIFDVVLCIDVLFHVLDDGVWRASLAGLARAAAAESIVIVTDAFPAERYRIRDYIVHRGRDEYETALAALDFHAVERTPYGFGANPNQFAVYRRAL